jgi:hypothetical protein
LQLGHRSPTFSTVELTIEQRSRPDYSDAAILRAVASWNDSEAGNLRFELHLLIDRCTCRPDGAMELTQQTAWTGERDDPEDPADHECFFYLGEFDNGIRRSVARVELFEGRGLLLTVHGEVDLGCWGEGVAHFAVTMEGQPSERSLRTFDAARAEVRAKADRGGDGDVSPRILNALLSQGLIRLTKDTEEARNAICAFLREIRRQNPSLDEFVSDVVNRLPNARYVDDVYCDDDEFSAAVRAAVGS